MDEKSVEDSNVWEKEGLGFGRTESKKAEKAEKRKEREERKKGKEAERTETAQRKEAEKRKEIVETSYKEKDAAYLTQIHLEEHIRMINEENACIHELEEKINNHWGWKILNPNQNRA